MENSAERKISTRLPYVDAMKGILILLMVCGHCFGEGRALKNLIVIFNMPAFFMLSGWLLKEDLGAFKDYLWKKILRILIPYLFFEMLMAGYQTIVNGFSVEYLKKIVTMECNIGADWYLITVFFSYLVVYPVMKLRKRLLILFVAGAIFLIGFFVRFNQAEIYLSRILIGAFFILAGYLARPYLARLPVPLAIAGLLGVIVAYLMNGTVDMWNGCYNNCVWFVLGGAGGFAAMLLLAKCCGKNPVVDFFGLNTIPIVGTNQFIIAQLSQITGSPVLLFLGAIIIEVPTILLLNKVVPFLVGKGLPQKKK